MAGPEDSLLQRQIDELMAQLASNSQRLQGLEDRADASEVRADAAERRADLAQDRADASEVRAQIDRDMVAELQAKGVLGEKNAAELEQALASSRTIGAAIGILMASRHVSQRDAFILLKEASQRSNRKLRDLATELVEATNQGKPPLGPS